MKLGSKHKTESLNKMSIIKIGKKQSKESIQKNIDSRRGYKHSEETKRKIGFGNKGKIRTKEMKEKNRLTHLGRKSKKKGISTNYIPENAFKKGHKPWNYIDGRSRNFGTDRYGINWHKIRRIALIRDNFTCQDCGNYSGRLEIHHKIPFLLTKNNDLSNLITLCKKCHVKEESRIIKELKKQGEV